MKRPAAGLPTLVRPFGQRSPSPARTARSASGRARPAFLERRGGGGTPCPRGLLTCPRRPHPGSEGSRSVSDFLRKTGAFGVLLGWLALVGPAGARQEAPLPPRVLEVARMLAVQDGGRVKPFDTFARERVRQITGCFDWKGRDPVETVLKIAAEPEHWQGEPLLSVPYRPLREALGLETDAAHVSYDRLIADRKLMRMLPAIVAKQQRQEGLNLLERETFDLYKRFVAFSGLVEHRFALVPPSGGSDLWRPVLEPAGLSPREAAQIRSAWSDLVRGIRQRRPQAALDGARRLAARAAQANPRAYPALWRLRLEVGYNRVRPFGTASVVYGAAAFLLLLTLAGVLKPAAWGLGLLWVGFLLHGAGILCRVVLGGRPPVSNFYETMLWLPLVGVAFSILFERIYPRRFFALAGAVLACLFLWAAGRMPLDSSISPVVAVLRSNLWLTVHVLTVVASYGAIALGVVLAHFYGFGVLAARGPADDRRVLETFMYRTVQVGVVLLFTGIVLGGVWANASWGRFWGWDPKETWALITLLWYLALLHGRFAGWLKGTGMALGVIAGFFLLLMTYYGVSFYLIGLHSYAGADAPPFPPGLLLYGAAELIFLAAVGWRGIIRQRGA